MFNSQIQEAIGAIQRHNVCLEEIRTGLDATVLCQNTQSVPRKAQTP